MDISRKIPEEDIRLLNELQAGLMRRDIKISQKELIDKAIKFSLKNNRENFIKMIKMKKTKKRLNDDKLLMDWLNNGVRIKGDILKEHDTVL